MYVSEPGGGTSPALASGVCLSSLSDGWAIPSWDVGERAKSSRVSVGVADEAWD